MQTIPFITVNLLDIPRNGEYQSMIRCGMDDHDKMIRASKVIGMSLSQFMRTVCVNAASAVLAEAVPVMSKLKNEDSYE